MDKTGKLLCLEISNDLSTWMYRKDLSVSICEEQRSERHVVNDRCKHARDTSVCTCGGEVVLTRVNAHTGKHSSTGARAFLDSSSTHLNITQLEISPSSSLHVLDFFLLKISLFSEIERGDIFAFYLKLFSQETHECTHTRTDSHTE